jgi:putative FmdB family regulatory protein
MPTYTYICNSCDYSFEEKLKISERNTPLKAPCFRCGEPAVSQTIKQVNVGDPVALGVKKLPEDFKRGVLDKAKRAAGAMI